MSGSVEGIAYYADPAGATIDGPAGTQVAAAKGDVFIKAASGKLTTKGLTVTATVTGGKVAGGYWLKGTGGALDASFGSPAATTIKGTATSAGRPARPAP